MPKQADLTGSVFGRLTVKGLTSDLGRLRGHRYWLCACSCDPDKKVVVTTSALNSGHTQSCGCLRVEAGRKSGAERGMTKHLNARRQPWLNL